MNRATAAYALATAVAVAMSAARPGRPRLGLALLLAANFALGAGLTWRLGYAASAGFDPVLDLACAMAAALWWRVRPGWWLVFLVASWAAQALAYVVWRPWSAGPAAQWACAWTVNPIFACQLICISMGAGPHAFDVWRHRLPGHNSWRSRRSGWARARPPTAAHGGRVADGRQHRL